MIGNPTSLVARPKVVTAATGDPRPLEEPRLCHTPRVNIRPRGRRLTGGAAPWLLALVLIFLLAVPAEGAEVETKRVPAEVTVGLDGHAVPGRAIPVRIRIDADRLVDGTLEIVSTAGGNRQRILRDVEVPGGSVKEVIVLVAGDTWALPSVAVAINSDGTRSRVGRTITPKFDPDLMLVGQLSAMVDKADVGEEIELPFGDDLVGDQRALVGDLDRELLDLGYPGVAMFDVVAATGSDLGSLSERQHEALLLWLYRGGVLLIDEAIGTTVDGLPEGVAPGESGWQRVGRGTVHMTDGAILDGRVAEVLKLAPTSAPNEEGHLSTNLMPDIWATMTQSLSRGAGFKLPDGGDLLTLLVVYAALVGPVTGFVLRRRGTRTLAWATVPVLALVFTGLVYLQGEEVRSSIGMSHATVIEVTPYGSIASSSLLVGSRTGGASRLDIAPSWSVAGLRDAQEMMFAWNPVGANQIPVTDLVASAEGAVVSMDLEPGEFRSFRVEGVAPFSEEPLEVDAESNEDGEVTARVTNNLDVSLSEVVVMFEDHAEHIDLLEAGETTEVTLSDVMEGESRRDLDGSLWPALGFDPFANQFGDMMVPPGGLGLVEEDLEDLPSPDETAVDTALWLDYMTTSGINMRAPGEVTAMGWSTELPSPVDAPEGLSESGHTLVVARANVMATAGRVTDASVSRHVVHASGQAMGPWGMVGGNIDIAFDEEQTFEGVYQFTLPPEVDGQPVSVGDLVLHLPKRVKRADLYFEDEWVNMYSGLGEDRWVSIPPSAFHEGRLYVRFNPASDLRSERDDPRLYQPADRSELELTTIEDLLAMDQFFEDQEPLEPEVNERQPGVSDPGEEPGPFPVEILP